MRLLTAALAAFLLAACSPEYDWREIRSAENGWSVLLPDARGHGLSEADTHSSLPRFAEDLDSALDWVRTTLGRNKGFIHFCHFCTSFTKASFSASKSVLALRT